MADANLPYEAHPAEVDVYEAVAVSLDTDAEPKRIENPEFYHPFGYIAETVSLMLHCGVLPDAGGLNDQSAIWVDDMRLYMRVRERVMWERAEEMKHKQGEDPIDDLLGGGDDAAMDWDAFAGGQQ